MPERRYALRKVMHGDYLLPSNDGRTLWRIALYTDGPSGGLTDWPKDRELWALWRWPEPIREGVYIDTLDWGRWDHVAYGYATRREAVDDAMARG